MNKFTKALAVMLLSLSLMLGGCATLTKMYNNIDPNDPTQQLLAATTIQVATSSYLEKNRDAAPLIVTITDEAMLYFSEDATMLQTTVELKDRVHAYIDDLPMLITSKIALKGLVDTIFSEAVKWAHIKVEAQLDEKAIKIFVWCAEQMNLVAKMYTVVPAPEVTTP